MVIKVKQLTASNAFFAYILLVSIMLKEEPENPKCFAEGRKDFTCFWEEDEEKAGSVDQYSFTYTYL